MNEHRVKLDTAEHIHTRYTDLFVHHPVQHALQLRDCLIHPLNLSGGLEDHAISANMPAQIPEYLGDDPQKALVTFFNDAIEQLHMVRKVHFNHDHAVYSANGFPEGKALNPEGKPNLYTQIEAVATLAKNSIFAEPEAEGATPPDTHASAHEARSQLSALNRAIGQLRARYEKALDVRAPLTETRRTLLTFSRDIVDTMHEVVYAANALQNEQGPRKI